MKREKKTYDVVLIERPAGDGLLPEEIRIMLDGFDEEKELLPVEIDSKYGDSSAMGFMTVDAEEQIARDESIAEFEDFIGNVLSDMSQENDDCQYEFAYQRIYLSRNVWSMNED